MSDGISNADAARFPRSFYSKTNVDDTEPAIIAAGQKCRVSWGLLIGGAADHVVTITDAEDGALPGTGGLEFTLKAGATVPIGGLISKNGLKVVTDDATLEDVGVVLAFAEPADF